jgi:hypothetical protein
MRINYKKIGVILFVGSLGWFLITFLLSLCWLIGNHFPEKLPFWLNVLYSVNASLMILSGIVLAIGHKDLLIDEFKKLY